MALLLACLAAAQAPTLRGVVRGAGGPLPGAQVEAVQGTVKLETVTGVDGTFALPQAGSGSWNITVRMTGFEPARETASGAAVTIELKVAPFTGAELHAAAPPAKSGGGTQPDAALAINGSEDNGAASPFALSPAFGNHRPGARSLYNGGFGLRLDSSHLDARTFSPTGQATPKPSYNDLTEFMHFGGPLLLPHLTNANNAPVFFAAYERTRDRSAVNSAALVPTPAQRAEATSSQAQALLGLYPSPNVNAAGARYNYQAALPSDLHHDSLQTRLSRFFSASNQVSGTFDLQSTRGSATNLFGFTDANGGLGLNADLQWRHSFSRDFFSTFAVQYSRFATRLTPFFANRVNIAANAGIAGGDASPANWGPPTLTFSSGLASLSDGLAQRNRNQTAAFNYAGSWIRNDHNWTFGGDLRRLEFNLWQQANPRGSFTFNGDATGDDLQDFLEGRADAVALAFGNADKYFRQSSYDAFVTDDWHASDALTLNLGMRWEYGAPMRERYGRLVNLALAPNFSTAATQVLADGGLRPDRRGFEPRLGAAWRPLAASSLLVSAGFGIYYDTSVYLNLAEQMAQQTPLSRSLAVAATVPLTLATGLETPAGPTPAVFAVDPGFRPGYAQTWDLALQNDLPGGYVASVTYLGTKGTHAVQRFYPNSYPPGSSNPCPQCPVGFLYEASNGNSTLNSGKAMLQRRFHNGLAFTASYTYQNAMDDAALGGGGAQTASVVAQNWLDLDAERARSSFDRRHQFSLQAQYSTGSRVLGGWLGRAYHEWTLTSQVSAPSGAPLTPLTFALVPGTGFTGVRPDVTGAAIGAAPPGLFVNPAAYSAPAPGQWGDAGRDSIEGPSQFGLNTSLQRSFALRGGLTANLQVDATNALNHVSYSAWNTTVGSALFGLPLGATPMRSLLTTLRFEF